MNTSIRALNACKTLSEAKEIAAELRETAIAIEKKYGVDSAESKPWTDRYVSFVDEMAYMYNEGLLAK